MGLFETAPAAAREKALAWLRHIREVEYGRPGGADSGGVVRAGYDPDRWTLAERERDAAATETEEDCLDGLDQDVEDPAGDNEALGGPAAPVAGYGLYDAQEEADKW